MAVEPTVVIAHTPWDAERRSHVLAMRRRLGGLPVRVVPDLGWKTCSETFLRALRSASSGTHVLLLTDDMLPCGDFERLLIGAIEARPDDAICLFSMRQIVGQARERGDSWYVCSDGWWGGACVMPQWMVSDYLRWVKLRWKPGQKLTGDGPMSLYSMEAGLDVWTTVPSLLEHIGAARSMIGNSNRNRIAHWYAGDDPPEIDWRAGVDEPLRASPTTPQSAWSKVIGGRQPWQIVR